MTGEPSDPKPQKPESIPERNKRRLTEAVQRKVNAENNVQPYINRFIASVPPMMDAVVAESKAGRFTPEIRERVADFNAFLQKFRKDGEDINTIGLAVGTSFPGLFVVKREMLERESLSDEEIENIATEFYGPFAELKKGQYEAIRDGREVLRRTLDGFPDSPIRDALLKIEEAMDAALELLFPPVRH